MSVFGGVTASDHLAPLAGRGRREAPGEGDSPHTRSRRLPLTPTLSPQAAGLSHMAEGSHKECIVPSGALDFAPDGGAVWVGSQDVEGEPAENGEVFWSIVLSCAIAVLG